MQCLSLSYDATSVRSLKYGLYFMNSDVCFWLSFLLVLLELLIESCLKVSANCKTFV